MRRIAISKAIYRLIFPNHRYRLGDSRNSLYDGYIRRDRYKKTTIIRNGREIFFVSIIKPQEISQKLIS